ncbi:hypothetical protein C8R44DRAFT_625218 [Mycena epipterygia]|nr:hypothetical protein C8R44DRAFT_625218 [Mycena epipterygia]
MQVDDERASEIHQVQELWFEDGNLVIQAGNSQFRVYRGILAARSPVFGDMLAFPQPPDSELIDGCPLVHLPDAATEVALFLKALFDPEFFMPCPAPTTFDIVIACLRLGHKYDVDYLRRHALIHLSSGYRTTLSERDSCDYVGDPLPKRSASDIMSWPGPDSDVAHMCTIQLAREIDALWVLPLAFYALSAAFSTIGSGIFQGVTYNGLPVSLSIQDQQTFLIGHTSQMTSTNADILRFLFWPLSADIVGCTSSTQCSAERLGVFESIRELIRDNPSVPLDIWLSTNWKKLRNVCPACLAVLKRTHKDARRAFWDRLPTMYGLPPWDELEKMKAAAIGKGSTVL